MQIVNESNTEASWFCYNSDDAAKMVALASGDLKANGDSFSYNPPQNTTGRYYVEFTVKGGGSLGPALLPAKAIFGGAEVTASGTIVMRGSSKPYQIQNAETGKQAG
jgi:hypothetical protein